MSNEHLESSDIPYGDEAEEFLKRNQIEKDPETQTEQIKKEGVIKLYKLATQIELQARKISDIHTSKVDDKGEKRSTFDNGTYIVDIKSNISPKSFRLYSSTPYVYHENYEDVVTEGKMEGRPIAEISLYDGSSGVKYGPRNGFTQPHYMFCLETEAISSGKDIGLVWQYIYIIGEDGKYLKLRWVNERGITYPNITDVSPAEFEVIGMFMGALKQRLSNFEEEQFIQPEN